MTTPPIGAAPPPPFMPRRRDRRTTHADLLTALSRAVASCSDATSMRGTFENELVRLLRLRSVHLRDVQSAWTTRPADGAESIALDVPVPRASAPAVLEATFDPGAGLGEWDVQVLASAAHLAALVLEVERVRRRIARAGLEPAAKPKRDGAAPLIGSTPVMQRLRQTIERAARTDFTVLLEGESGVGKELVARQIHDISPRSNGPFVAINCAALVETLLEAELFGIEERTATGVRGRRGKFEHADGGTVFLDEVSDLSLSAQAKLLRAIQDLAVERVGGTGCHRVNLRIIAATNRPLGALVATRLFRPDLFYRLSGVNIHVPSLRERRADVLELARYFLERHRSTRPLRLSPAAADALTAYEWPGNVRELERLVEGAIAFAPTDMIELDDLPLTVRGETTTELVAAGQRNDSMRAWGSRYARLVLNRSGGNKREACRVLSISYHTLNAYLKVPLDGAAKPDDRPSDDELEEEAESKCAEV